MGALDGGGGEFGDPLADGGGAGEGDHGDVGVGDQVLAGGAAGAGDHVDDPVGDAGLGAGGGEHQRGERGEFGGLEDDGVAGRDRREDLPGGHLQRVVPRRDRADHADRLAADVGGVVAGVLAGGLALQVAGGAGEERGVVDGAGDVELGGELDRLAGLGGLDAGELLGAVGEDAGQPVECLGAGAGGGAGPAGQGGAGGRDRGVDVTGGGQDDILDGAAVGGVDDLEGLVPGAGDRSAVDVLRARGEAGLVHHVPPCARWCGAADCAGPSASCCLGAAAIPVRADGRLVESPYSRRGIRDGGSPGLRDPDRPSLLPQGIPLLPSGYATDSNGDVRISLLPTR
ncbi:hypothetical protein GCM10025734_56890 [Kitasatospora paranensis]